MHGERILLVVLIVRVTLVSMQSSGTDEISVQCPPNGRVNLTGETLDQASGFMVKSGYLFPPESLWTEGNEIFGCVCYTRSDCAPLYCPEESSLHYRIYPYCEEPVNNTTENNESSLATEPLVYSVDLPIETVALDYENVYAEQFFSNCKWMGTNIVVTNNLSYDGIYVRSDGSIYTPERNISVMYNFDSYCLCNDTYFYNYSPSCRVYSIIYTTVVRSGNSTGNNTFVGAPLLAHFGMMISIPFLIVTFIVYTILPEMKNIHGLTLRGYVACLIVAYTTLAIIQITGPISGLSCLFFAFTIYFTFLASFFWLNAMSFDIWWSFGGLRSIRANVDQRNTKRFFIYLIYAFGCAGILTAICMIMDLIPEIPEKIIRPEFGVESDCWFKTDGAKALYFYGPMGLTIVSNIFFFVSTAVKIIRHKKNTAKHLKGVNSKRHDDKKQWFNLYLKLFILMGINWAMEIVSWLYKDLKYLWYITDLANALQGLIIFIIFICKKNILRLLVKRFGWSMPNFLSEDSTRHAVHSSASQTATTSVSPSQ